jgi:glycerophosphoryl diester phosphodiesterase
MDENVENWNYPNGQRSPRVGRVLAILASLRKGIWIRVKCYDFNKLTMLLKLIVLFDVALCCCPMASAQQPNLECHLIAHRGGVVDKHLIEHSLAGLNSAIDRGYWMVEVDVRKTKDGLPIVQHDGDFRRYFNHPVDVSDMTWDQIKLLRSSLGNCRPLLLNEFAAACRGKIRLMVEIKGPSHNAKFYELIEQILRENNLLDEAIMIGIPEAKAYFRGKLRTSVQRNGLISAVEAGEDVESLYFLFHGARHLEEETIEYARAAGVPIVAAFNKHHYQGENAMPSAEAESRRMIELKVRTFQIDSIYEHLFQQKIPGTTSALPNLSFCVDAQVNLCPASTYGCGYPKSKAWPDTSATP